MRMAPGAPFRLKSAALRHGKVAERVAKGIQSILIGFRLLQALTDADSPMTLKTLAAVSAMSPSKARMYLISFLETGLVAQSLETSLYTLGPYAIRLGTRALQRMEMMEFASDAMRTLQQQTNSLVLLCAWDTRGVIIVSRLEGSEPQPLQFHIGGTASLTSTATGHIFLAFGPREQTWPHLEEEVANLGLSKTEQRKRVKALEVLAEDVRQRRLADADPISYASGVTLSGFAAIAAPIFDEAQHLRYAITLIYRTDRQIKRKEELIRLTVAAANRASHLAGALPDGTNR
jgi:DNA-binding IclR family transcriptional regulator